MRKDDDAWLESPEPIGYVIEEVDGYFDAYQVDLYWNGKESVGSLSIAYGLSRKRVARKAEKVVAHHHRIWSDRRNPGKTERVIMYGKPPTVAPKGSAGDSGAHRRMS